MKKPVSILLALVFLLSMSLPAYGAEERDVTSLDELSTATFGVFTGSNGGPDVEEHFPEAKLEYYNSLADMLSALRTKKVDAIVIDEGILRYLTLQNDDLAMVKGAFSRVSMAAAFPKTDQGQELCDQYSEFIRAAKEDGTLAQVDGIWFGEDEDAKTVLDYEALPDTNGTLTMAVESTFAPFVYIKDEKIVGYDVDLAARFCEAYGYRLKVVDVGFAGALVGVQSGKYDFSSCNITVTPERSESMLFSEPNFEGGNAAVVLKSEGSSGSEAESPSNAEYTSFSELSGKTVSMLNGAPFEDLVRSKAPDVGEFTFFNNMTDMLLALKSGKTDAILQNNAISQLAVNKNPELTIFPEELKGGMFGIAFAKGDPRRDEWQAAYDTISEETKQALWEKWTGSDESVKALPEQDWPGLNGTVTVAACDTLEPMSYAGEGGAIMGFDNEMILLMAKELDVHVKFTGMEFSAIMSAVQGGKADLGCGSIIVTDERKESVDFVEYYPAAFVLIVRAAGTQVEDNTFWGAIRSSFEKTFLRENRWQLFVEGIVTTLVITVASILLGTALGFLVFLVCRGGNAFANQISGFCIWLVQGMPMVVLLMVLYYIVFGSVSIDGAIVAVLGFTLTFGSSVFGLMKLGVGAVDRGQYEAACALGYSDSQTFFKIILPQALPHVMGAYKGEVVSLIKATAIVGYIAVQDLTKMGDIVRSRTYEAFFPLIAVTVIYFVMEGLLGLILKRADRGMNPRRRSREDILKGVHTDD
jgi:polar amino acid transport system substrate-binding protein